MLGVALPFGLATPTFIIESFYNILKSNLLLLLILLSVWIFVICFCLGTFFTEHASIIYVSPLNCIRYPDATTTVAHVNFVLQAVLTHTDIRVWDKGRRFPLEISHTLNSGISYLPSYIFPRLSYIPVLLQPTILIVSVSGLNSATTMLPSKCLFILK